jgi:hypothetical protein
MLWALEQATEMTDVYLGHQFNLTYMHVFLPELREPTSYLVLGTFPTRNHSRLCQ